MGVSTLLQYRILVIKHPETGSRERKNGSPYRHPFFGCVGRVGTTRHSETPEKWRARNMKQASRKQNARVVRPRGSIGSLRFVGMWADRAEMKDSAEWIRIQRAGWIRRSSVVINGT